MRNPKELLVFSQKKAVLIFLETETPKKLLIFQEKETCLIFQKWNIQNPAITELLLYFRKLNFLALYIIHRIKEILYEGITTKSIVLKTGVKLLIHPVFYIKQ